MNSEQFVGQLVIRVLPHWEMPEGTRAKFELMQPFAFVSHRYGRIRIPKGFVTDFASVPSATKSIIDDDDPDLVFAAIPHDFLYKNKGEVEDAIMPRMCLTRYQADCILHEAMLAAGAPSFKAWLVFQAVRVGGAAAWRR